MAFYDLTSVTGTTTQGSAAVVAHNLSVTSGTFSTSATNYPLSIGGNTPYGEYFSGLIDEVRVYNRALSQAEVQTDMATAIAPLAPDTTPPTAPSGLVASAPSSTR